MKLNSKPASISWVISGLRFGLLNVVLSSNPPREPYGNPVRPLLPRPALKDGNVAYQLASDICPVFDQPPLTFKKLRTALSLSAGIASERIKLASTPG